MHQGIARVAVCFLAKFGLFYVFFAWVFSLVMTYVLVTYLTSDLTNKADNGNQPSSPSLPEDTDNVLFRNSPHLKLTSNLKHLHLPLGSSWNSTPHDDMKLMSYVHKYSILPSCDQTVFLNIFVTSAPRNFKQRSAIRKTWCSLNMTSVISVGQRIIPDHVTRCIFLIGRSMSYSIQNAVRSEAMQHHDILQGLYLDSYRNLTIKVLQGLIWSHRSCPSAYILKTDDDCFVNIPIVKLLLGQASRERNIYLGHVMGNEARRKVIRDPDSKWHVSASQFSSQYYPPYVSGFGYLLSWDLVEIITSIYRSINIIPIEDAYIGILLNSVGITPIHSDRFNVHSIQWHLCNLLYFVVIHKVTIESQALLSSQCVHSYLKCSIKNSHIFLWD
ncbi:hypothetical protein LSH36_591g00003 [Paralvinella palmiformis]|uniref:Hexosyltransferase n=1 Tax=Paralvinella palmiformis TaxID=53620 RepID=A0AAD9J5Y2_9ANNE|nr:hypothetical protein LSH36_591g00003 [Paralvinella palmiformis]